MSKRFKKTRKATSDEAVINAVSDAVTVTCMTFTLRGDAGPQHIATGMIRALEAFVLAQMFSAHQRGTPPDDILSMASQVRDLVKDRMDKCAKEYLETPNLMNDFLDGLAGRDFKP